MSTSNFSSSSSSSSSYSAPVVPFEEFQAGKASWSMASLNKELWEKVEYNSTNFNVHMMPNILVSLAKEPREEALANPKLDAYLTHAQHSVSLWNQLESIPAKDLASSIIALRQLGSPAAEDLSDAIVGTVCGQLRNLTLGRVSFFVTTFNARGIRDAVFWRTAAAAVIESKEELSPQVLVSLFDAFRKSGLKSERLFQALTHRIYPCLEELDAGHIPPIVASICRVPLKAEDLSQALRPLITRYQNMLREENTRAERSGQIKVGHICSMTISLSLTPEEINTAVFAMESCKFIEKQLRVMNTEDIIVFLWGIQQLTVPAAIKSTLLAGTKRIGELWSQIEVASGQGGLSLQRLTQLADVLVLTGGETGWPKECIKLQDSVIDSVCDLLHYCSPKTFADQLEIWSGGAKFWKRYPDFARGLAKTLYGYLSERPKLQEIWPALQVVKDYPELLDSLPEGVEDSLARAVQLRGASDQERMRALFAGTSWERLCGELPQQPQQEEGQEAREEDESSAAAAEGLEVVEEGDEADGDQAHSRRQRAGGFEGQLSEALESTSSTSKAADASSAAGAGAAVATPAHRTLFQAFTASAPFAQRRGRPEGTEQAYKKLLEIADLLEIAASEGELTHREVFTLLRSCAAAGLPHVGLFKIAANGSEKLGSTLKELKPLEFVEALESAAKVRLRLPELDLALRDFVREGRADWLHGPALIRLLLAASQIGPFEEAETLVVLQRILELSARSRVPTSLCYALHLSTAIPSKMQLDRICQSLEEPRTPVQKMVMRDFALGILADKKGLEVVKSLPPRSRTLLAEAALGDGVQHQLLEGDAPVSDSTLRLRHEVTETLRRAGKEYDLEIPVAPGLTADVALPGPAGILWLLDGPEAFHHPLNSSSTLLPSEERRGELLRLALDDDALEDLEGHLQSWLPAGRSVKGQLLASPSVNRSDFPKRVARLDFKSWSNLSETKRSLVLIDPRSYLLRRR